MKDGRWGKRGETKRREKAGGGVRRATDLESANSTRNPTKATTRSLQPGRTHRRQGGTSCGRGSEKISPIETAIFSMPHPSARHSG